MVMRWFTTPYVPKGSEYLPERSIEDLVTIYRREKDSKASIRLLCAIHRKNGKSIPEIAEILIIPVSTVSDHLRRLLQDFSRLYDKRNQQRPSKLTSKQHQQLIKALKKPPIQSGLPGIVWTTKMVQYYIQHNFGKNFTVHGVRKLLYRENFALLKPRPYHAKGDSKQQEDFKKNYPKELHDICEMDMRSSFWTSQDSS